MNRKALALVVLAAISGAAVLYLVRKEPAPTPLPAPVITTPSAWALRTNTDPREVFQRAF